MIPLVSKGWAVRIAVLSALVLLLAAGEAPPEPAVKWRRADAGIRRTATVTDIAFAPDGVAYVALYEPAAVYRSFDGLTGWEWLGSGMLPLVPLSLLADGEECLWVGTEGGLWRSCRGRWERVAGAPAVPVYDLARLEAGRVAAGTEHGLFVCSAEGCRGTGVAAPALAVAAAGGLACAGTAAAGLWCSRGGPWLRVEQAPVSVVNSLALDEKGRVYYTSLGQLHACRSLGEACRPVLLPQGAPARVVLARGDLLLVGTAGHGVFLSRSGDSWLAGTAHSPFCSMPSAWPEITSLAVHPASGLALAGTIGAGLYYTGNFPPQSHGHNAQWSWQPVADGPGRKVVHALVQPDPGRIYAGGPGGIYLSQNHGETWLPLGRDCGPTGVQALAVAGQNLLAGTADGVYASGDGGGTWRLLTQSLGRQTIFSLAVDPHQPERLYAGCWGNNILLSTDGGLSWAPIHSGLETLSVHSLAVSPFVPGVMYAGTVEGVYCTRNNGASWAECSEGLPPKTTVFCLLHSGRAACTLYAGTTSGLYLTQDCGRSWHASAEGASLGTVYACLLLEGRPKTILCGTEQGGAWLSRDNGATWQPLGLKGRSVYSLVALSDGSVMAGTDDGVYLLEPRF